MEKHATNRLLALEGLRGIAAIGVVIFHALLIFYPAFYYGSNSYFASLRNSRFEGFMYGNPLSVFLSGTFAVAIFFVLSGFVLSIGFFQTGDQKIIQKLATKRYIRLMLPALASIVIVWLLLSSGLGVLKDQVSSITGSTWLASLWRQAPNLGDALAQGLRSIFATGDVTYNPVLWTMKYELIGSFLVFFVAMLFKQARHRWVIYAILIIGLLPSWYGAFMIGLVLADLYSTRSFPFSRPKRPTLVLVLIIGLFLGGYPFVEVNGTVYQTMRISWMSDVQNQTLYLTLGAACLLVVALTLTLFVRFLSSRPISLLGKYTFSLYLTHMPVLFTVCCGLFLWLHSFLGFNAAALLSMLATVPCVVLIAFLFEKYVDGPSINLSGVFANWILGFPQKDGESAYSYKNVFSVSKLIERVVRPRTLVRPKNIYSRIKIKKVK